MRCSVAPGLRKGGGVQTLCLSLVILASARASEVPLEYRDGLLWVTVETDRPLRFLVDTGAAASVMDNATAGRLDLKRGERATVCGVGWRASGYWTQPVTVRLGETAFTQKFLAVDLQPVSRACGRPVDGLLGADFFRGRVAQIDYRAERLRLLDVAPGGRALPVRMQGGAMCVPVRVNGGARQWVRLDTGCASALQWVSRSRPVADDSISIGWTKIPAPAVVETTVELGTERWENVPTGLQRREIFAGEAGLLGNGLLSRYTVTIDGRGWRVVLE